MLTDSDHHSRSSPDRGAGHYSDDGRRWWDGRRGGWFPVEQRADTLEIELEDVGGTSWVRSLLTTLGSQMGSVTYRFVGAARSEDPRWPTYRINGDTFVAPRSLRSDIDPQEAWAPGMTAALRALRSELAEQGWLLTGHGDKPWSYRYSRPWIALPDPAGR